MAIRVRKLARELRRPPAEILGMLRTLGYERFKSAHDMLPDAAVNRVRKGYREGLDPILVALEERAKPPTGITTGGMMGQLVPGVRPISTVKPVSRTSIKPVHVSASAGDSTQTAPVPPVSQMDAAAVPKPRDVLVVDEVSGLHSELALVRDQLLVAQAAQRASELALVASVASLAEVRAQVLALSGEIIELRASYQGGDAPSLADMLIARGLRGQDEMARALRALAERRQLADLIPHLWVGSPSLVREKLQRKLVLVGGSIPEALPAGLAAVSVAPERGEVLPSESFALLTSRFGEDLLLNGLRRVVIIGGRSLDQHLLSRSVDVRVELRFQVGGPRGRVEAEQDVTRTDVVVLWGEPPTDDALQVYQTSRVVLVEVVESTLAALFEAVHNELAGS